ncbi:hypothetical protein [Pseudomarimonas salicorniae]|uniref:Pilus assembly protein n=1 Tax=Pseudomarimonas salicorniae TaxID=2933270 RepID=A0ABT0GG49_9GAMM|nr:hypothetical protein [Lysobacter sp. CAU 1642]MCK7593327.1 hypothetical protein [Lysobacter sp. CAU 1642]
MSRWKAAGIHLLISLGVVAALAALMLSTWYARGLFQFAQADRLLLLVGAIDVTVGPLLTLLVFRAGKKGLKLDLSLIGLAQVAFLAYGLSVVWISRPAFLVALPERVQLVFANEIDPDTLPVVDGALPRSRVPWLGPELVGARRPQDPAERARLVDELIAGRDLPAFPKYYVPFPQLADDLLAASESIESLGRRLGPDERRALHERLRAEYGNGARWVPIVSSRGTATLFIDPETALPLRADPFDPR